MSRRDRLQNSPYFCVFKYARAVKQKVWNDAENRERDWGETLGRDAGLTRPTNLVPRAFPLKMGGKSPGDEVDALRACEARALRAR